MASVNINTLKDEIGITWDNESTNRRLNRYLSSGKALLKRLLGSDDLTFDEGTEIGDLLINYCEYRYYKKGEFFEENYASDIQRLRYDLLSEGCGADDEN